MHNAKGVWRCQVSHLELLLLRIWSVLAIMCFTTSEGRYVSHMKVVPAISVRDGSQQGYNGLEVPVGKDPETPVSNIQTLALGGRKLLQVDDRHFKEVAHFIDFVDYPGPGESTPITDPPPVPPYQTDAAASVHFHADYPESGTHPPGEDGSDKPTHDVPLVQTSTGTP
ncbi:hypothetical protein R1sor_003813 [Riccia sorocarpa]|uniref:Uncharacterized protein n=1 Tax=Riccia sorocarpa TaxID=122646 RepID=A0ABD3H4H1_9MARC